MKKFFVYFCMGFFVILTSVLQARDPLQISPIKSVCYAGNEVKRVYIPPPVQFFKNATFKKSASITVHYDGFPEVAEEAFDYAVSILESLLPEDTYITINAIWANLESAQTLANSSATSYLAGWGINALNPYAYYPITLGEKISGESFNSEDAPDIEVRFNSSANWYCGTDGKTPDTMYDMVTVVIHELIHGLGFADSFRSERSTASYGFYSVPVIYDTFVESVDGRKLTDTLLFNNPSPDLKMQITSKDLFFNSPLLSSYTLGERARLYAPSIYDEGSSVSHLDETTTPEIDQLMTPVIDRAEAIHDPGAFTMSMLGDLGWINTRIIHDELKDTEENITDVTISATIKSDTLYDHSSVGLVWSFNGFDDPRNIDTTFLVSYQSDDNYTTTLTIPSYGSMLEYYLYVEDSFSRTYRLPSFTDQTRYSAYIGTDTVKPAITYTHTKYYLETIDTIFFNVAVTDNIGIDTVVIEYIINDEEPVIDGLVHGNDDEYGYYLNAEDLFLQPGDIIKYRITAVDEANNPNLRVIPSTEDYYTTRIEQINLPDFAYTTDFTDASGDFLDDGIKILKPSGFTKYGLHTPHPYMSPEESGDSIGYTALLRTPVIYDPNGMIITYRELVLVEPGDEGYEFGSTYFYDYVIVEASVDFGKSWFPLSDGYDSRINKTWEEAYNSKTEDNNSTFIGKESMMLNHTIFPKTSSFLSPGDTMIIRFRLFSDPFANGWGWIIQDLHIGPLINHVEDISFSEPTVYPNPGNGLINIKQSGERNFQAQQYSIYSSSGVHLLTSFTDGGDEINIDLSEYPDGLYFIVFQYKNRISTLKYILAR
ncbi:MAG TPA: T9SS type A sorting domain-containing protein [Bacteroidales bacterium]|nr:T9SS type A sorting domain-containing protein [Bacteroidales bacterium]